LNALNLSYINLFNSEKWSEGSARWYEVLSIDAEEQLGKCLKKGDKNCEIVLKVNKWRK